MTTECCEGLLVVTINPHFFIHYFLIKNIMAKKKSINKTATIQNILNKINSSIGYSIDIKKFNERKDDEEFLIEAAKFCNVEVVYL